jgi:iron(III) transport system permease protein
LSRSAPPSLPPATPALAAWPSGKVRAVVVSAPRARWVPARPCALPRVTGFALCGAAAALIVAYPLGRLLWEALRAPAASVAGGLASVAPLIHTVVAVGVSTPLAVAIGLALALICQRAAGRGAAALRLGVLLPLIVPPFVSAFAWVQAYGAAGLSDRLLHRVLPGLFGPVGVILLLAVNAVPLPFATVSAALAAGRTRRLEEAARASGARGATVFWTVTLPLLRPALAAGAVLAAVGAASDFGIPAVVGMPGGFSTLTTAIYADLSFSADPSRFAAAIAQALLLCLLVAPGAAALGRLADSPAAPDGGATGAAWAGGRWLPALAWLYVALASGIPLVAAVLVALTRAYGLAPVPANWSLAHFRAAVAGANIVALGHSAALALATAAACCALGTPVAILARRGGAGRVLQAVVALPFALPGSVIAIAAILAWNRPLHGTLLLMGLAYVARFWTLAERPIGAAISGCSPSRLRAAQAAGAGPLAAWRTAWWPALKPAFAAAALLTFVQAFHELTISSLLYGPGSTTIAVAVLSAEQGGDVGTTAALAVLLAAVSLLAAIPLVGGRRPADWTGMS